MSKVKFMGEIKIKSTAEIVKECKAAGKSKKDAFNALKGYVTKNWSESAKTEFWMSID